MIKRYRALVTLVGAIGLIFGLVVAPASADTGGGEVGFEGTAHLPLFPCDPPDAPCSGGTFEGTITKGELSGVHNGTAWEVIASSEQTSGDQDMFVPDFSYSEENCEVGTADGTGTIDVAQAEGDTVVGTYGTQPIHRVTADFSFDWTRIGNTATVTTTVTVTVHYTDSNGNTVWATVITGHPDVAEATFVPMPDDPEAFAEACSGGDPVAIDAEVAGEDIIATD